MKVSLLSLLFVLLVGMLSPHVAMVNAVCGTARLRKSYDSLTVPEKLLYRKALQTAMDTGLYIKFVEMHTEKMSEMEAHRGCMFAYWHRYFLLGFENMLRSLGPEYECITVPYWDEMQHNARAMTGSCSSMESCAPMLRDWGGSSSGDLNKSLKINGAWVSGYRCVKNQPLNHFCEASSVNGTACAKCLPRGNMQQTVFPSGTNFASVQRQLFTTRDFVGTTKSVEDGMHSTFLASPAPMCKMRTPRLTYCYVAQTRSMRHSVVRWELSNPRRIPFSGRIMYVCLANGKVLLSLASSLPLDFAFHLQSYVDLLLTIYLKCRAGLGKLTDQQKQNNQYSFVSCPHREDAGFFTSSSTVTMRAGENGVNPKQVNQQGQTLYPFFKDLPSRYYQLADITTLGANRYNYQVGGLVAKMAVNCERASTGRRLHEDKDDHTKRQKCRSELDEADVPESGPEQSGSSTQGDAFEIDTSLDKDVDAGKVQSWIAEVKQQFEHLRVDKSKDPEKEGLVFELEKMVCMFYDQCRGGITDYSDEFKTAFNVTEPPPCKPIVDDINSECKQIRLANWKETMEKYFPCNAPMPADPPASSLESDLSASTSSSSSAGSAGAYKVPSY